MVLIWKDTYEDLTEESFDKVLDGFASGNPPKPGPQIDRQFSAPMAADDADRQTSTARSEEGAMDRIRSTLDRVQRRA